MLGGAYIDGARRPISLSPVSPSPGVLGLVNVLIDESLEGT